MLRTVFYLLRSVMQEPATCYQVGEYEIQLYEAYTVFSASWTRPTNADIVTFHL